MKAPPRSRDVESPVLAAVARRHRFVRAVEGALATTAVLFLTVVAACVLDNALHLGPLARRAIGLAGLAAVGLVAARRLGLPLLRPLGREEAALLVERAFPELDDRLINAELLARDPTTPPVVLEIMRGEALSILGGLDLGLAVPARALRRLAVAAAVAFALFAGYALVLPAQLANALARYASPAGRTAPLTRTRLLVTPGDCVLVEGQTLAIRAEPSGEIPASAKLVIGRATYDLRFTGGAFAHDLERVETSFDYSIQAGDAETPVYHVQVKKLARIQRLQARYAFPDYLKLPERTDERSSGTLAAVLGTRVRLSVELTKPVRVLELAASEGLPVQSLGAGVFELVLAKSGTYRLTWTDEDGLAGASATYAVTAQRDAAPVVRLVEPARAVFVREGGDLPVALRAEDDLGLASIGLRAQKGDLEPVGLADLPAKGRDVKASRALKVQELGRAGDKVALFAVARDLAGQEARSPAVVVTIGTEADAAAQAARELASLVARLKALVARERALRDRVVAGGPVDALEREQASITRDLAAVHASWNEPDLRRVAARERLLEVVRGPATRAVSELREDLARAAKSQAEVIAGVEAVIAVLEGLEVALAKGTPLEQALAPAQEKLPRQKLEDLLAGLKDLVPEQKKVIEDTLDLKTKGADDFTDEQKKKLEALRQTEEKWGEFLKEKATDLSKVPPQDFTNGSLVKELNEAASELAKAAEALGKKATEIAVPAEQSGLELAKSITENIERWLASGPDSAKWVMEEPKGEADVPMADLPAELEDLIGELADKEDKLAEDAQDVTSSWMDSMDKGVGWGVGDGPIANMSAKGITGNLQPNSQEIAGRSGEGRSGKSSGQMVEDTATGKGGKQTPTRSTPDPYEAGRVKDTSKDPTGGSTGGGKVSGVNKEGLRGAAPPPIKDKMDRLADAQADVRNKAEKVNVALGKKGVTSADLAAALEAMKKLEERLRAGRPQGSSADARAIAERLEQVRRQSSGRPEQDRDPTRAGAARKDAVGNAGDEEIPEEFRDWVKEYYRGLSDR